MYGNQEKTFATECAAHTDARFFFLLSRRRLDGCFRDAAQLLFSGLLFRERRLQELDNVRLLDLFGERDRRGVGRDFIVFNANRRADDRDVLQSFFPMFAQYFLSFLDQAFHPAHFLPAGVMPSSFAARSGRVA
jgi:hypothetical protein